MWQIALLAWIGRDRGMLESQALISAVHWQLSSGNGVAGLLADALLFFLVAIFLLAYLGAGIAALTLPANLRPHVWTMAPYLGYSLLVVVSSLLVALGGTVAGALAVALALSTAANLWAIRCHGIRHPAATPIRGLLPLVLSLFSYGITAATMAHNGFLYYVGGQGDLYLLVPLAEWLKSHSAPLLSLDAPNFLAPYWNANVPPIGGWFAEGAHLGYAGHRPDDANFLFQRGPVYLQSSLGLLLGWDAALVFRPAQAFMLSLAMPSTFLFCRHLVRASRWTSVLAALLVGLNGTLFWWVLFGHPGQAASLFLVPVAVVVAIFAIQSHERAALLSAILLLSALVVSYYQGAPLVAFLLVPGIAYALKASGRRRAMVIRVGLLASGVLVLALPEHLKFALVWLGDAMVQTSGWGDPSFPPPGDALGSTVHIGAFETVAGRESADDAGWALWRHATSAATLVALVLAVVGAILGRAPGIGLYRFMLLGALALPAYLRISGYPYGYAKAQAGITFMVAIALSIGVVELWNHMRPAAGEKGRLMSLRRASASVGTALPVLLLVGMVGANLAISAYAFWKPVGNIWDSRSWESIELARTLPRGSVAKFSPNVLSDPTSEWIALYSLRDQVVQGPFALRDMVGQLGIAQELVVASREATADFTVLGTGEVAGVRGLPPADQVWGASLLEVYRGPKPAEVVAARVPHPGEPNADVPVPLPTAVEVRATGGRPEEGGDTTEGSHLLIALAAESPTRVQVATARETRFFEMEAGLAVRSIPVNPTDHVVLSYEGSSEPWLVSASVMVGDEKPAVAEHYPTVLMAVGNSRLDGSTISTEFVYLDRQVPASHSLDLFDQVGEFHPAWFQLPISSDGRLRHVRFQIDGASLDHRSWVNGAEGRQQHSTKSMVDGEYVAYFSTSYGADKPSRVPLYRYRLEKGQVVNFESFPLLVAWEDRGEAEKRP